MNALLVLYHSLLSSLDSLLAYLDLLLHLYVEYGKSPWILLILYEYAELL